MIESSSTSQYKKIMSGIEDFTNNKQEFNESFKGLKNEPNLISFDGPDGVGKSDISERVTQKLKEKFISEGKDPLDIIVVKYTSLMDTNSQINISTEIRKCKDKNGAWDKEKMDKILKLWSAKCNRSYGDHVLPLLRAGKTVIMDRSEIDIFRAAIEWGDDEALNKITKYMKEGTLTHGINAGNRIFISSIATDTQKNLMEREQPLSSNDPRNLHEMVDRVKNEIKAEKYIMEMSDKKPNLIKMTNRRVEDETERNNQLNEIAKEIISKLKLEKE